MSCQHLELLFSQIDSRCTVDILSQILSGKTIDVGKTSLLLIKDNI